MSPALINWGTMISMPLESFAGFNVKSCCDHVTRVHELWLKLSRDRRLGSHLHHRDVVAAALRRLEAELGGDYEAIVAELERQLGKR